MSDRLRRLKAIVGDQFKGASVRLATGQGKKTMGLCTSTYCYSLPVEDKQYIARRIAALWNCFSHLSTEEIERLEKEIRRKTNNG